ncbi:MAG: AtpZ/AtpI family protein [Anaerolineaceae bacterium]|nr:AtpZ/AtpI family protein [Anaerolineaceae bacterium]
MSEGGPERAPVLLLGAKVIAQVGALLVMIAGGSVLIGLALDEALGTKPLFVFVLLLGSIPLSLWAIYRYSQHQSRLILAAQKEEGQQ